MPLGKTRHKAFSYVRYEGERRKASATKCKEFLEMGEYLFKTYTHSMLTGTANKSINLQ